MVTKGIWNAQQCWGDNCSPWGQTQIDCQHQQEEGLGRARQEKWKARNRTTIQRSAMVRTGRPPKEMPSAKQNLKSTCGIGAVQVQGTSVRSGEPQKAPAAVTPENKRKAASPSKRENWTSQRSSKLCGKDWAAGYGIRILGWQQLTPWRMDWHGSSISGMDAHASRQCTIVSTLSQHKP